MAATDPDSERQLIEVRRRIKKFLELRDLYGELDTSMAAEYAELCKTEARLLGKDPSP